MYLREAVNRFRALIGAVTKLGLCICKFDSEKVSASPATNLTARHWIERTYNTSVHKYYSGDKQRESKRHALNPVSEGLHNLR